MRNSSIHISIIFPNAVTAILKFEPAHYKTYNKTCVTNKDSDQPVHPPNKARALIYPFFDGPEAVKDTCDYEVSDQTEQMRRVIWVFAGRISFIVDFPVGGFIG